MADEDVRAQLEAMSSTLRTIESVLKPESMREELAGLQEQASAPDLWDDQDKAQAVTSRLSFVQSELGRLDGLRKALWATETHSWWVNEG